MTRRHPVPFPRALLGASVAAATVWTCLFAWGPLVEDRSGFLAPLLLGVAGVAVVGATARWQGVRPLGVALLHVLLGGALLLLLTVGSPVPTPAAWSELLTLVDGAAESAQRYAAPVPADAPPLDPLFLAVGMVAAVVLDLVALSWRRVALGALLLLALHLVPANLGVDVPWWIFCLVAAGFLTLLHLDTDALVVRWGSSLATRVDHDGPGVAGGGRERTPPASGDGPTAHGAGAAVRIGALATVGALVVAAALGAVVPHSPFQPWNPGKGSGPQVTLTSPLVDMRRDLDRGANIPLLLVESQRRPTYVRNAVLSTFDGSEWSTGDRSALPLPAPGGPALPLAGVDPLVGRTEMEYSFSAAAAFRSRWLPVMPQSSQVVVEGDWRWDRDTSDVAAFDADLTTAGRSWRVTGVQLDLTAELLERAASGRSEVPRVFTSLPSDLPEVVSRTAEEVTAQAPTRFAKAQVLQDWFRSEFDYSLDQVETVDNDALVEFLSPAGRVGYCEQFAAAMAVMARTLGIPSRVAVGFLEPRRVGVTDWQFSSHDLHAWPELYFPGAGWVRFEPTPASRASGVPDYTETQVEPGPRETTSPTPTQEPTPPSPTPSARPEVAPETTQEGGDDGVDVPWARMFLGASGLLVLAGLALTPQLVRERRRRRRLVARDAEEWWAELRDSAVDLGHDWPEGQSPRATGAALLEWVPEGAARDRASGRLDQVVVAVERSRFARPDGTQQPEAHDLGGEVEALAEALGEEASRGARWQARWLPRSLVRRGTR